MSREAKILIVIAGVVVVGGVLLAIFANPQPKQPGAPVDSQSLVRDSSHMTGKKDAKVTIVEFGDYECPACGAAYPITKQLLSNYQGNDNVNFVFRNFPLTTIHPNAEIGAEAAEAAAEQGKFWEMHDLLYEKQTEWAESTDPMSKFVGYAQQLGLDVNKFQQEVNDRKFSDIIKADEDDGNGLGVNATPTFYINGEKMDTYQYDALKSKVDEQLNK